jgi:hypothetical protein
MRMLRAVFLAAAPLVVGCIAEAGSETDDFTAADFSEDTVLPYAGNWLDAPKALDGVSQFDRLKGTVHDDAKCSTMVATAAAIVGGKARFLTLLDALEKKRAGQSADLATLAKVRHAVDQKKLTPRRLHELTEVMVRAYKVADGAYDWQIAAMVRASGYVAVHVGSSKPAVLVDHLLPNEVVPLAIVSDNVPHITLIWKDAAGTVRLYDSDNLHHHVFARGSAGYRERVEDPQSAWDRGEKYR